MNSLFLGVLIISSIAFLVSLVLLSIYIKKGNKNNNTKGILTFNSNLINVDNNVVVGSGYLLGSSNAFGASQLFPRNATLYELHVLLSAAPGPGNTRTITVQINNQPTNLRVVLSVNQTSASIKNIKVKVLEFQSVSLLVTNFGNPNPSFLQASLVYK